MSAVTRDIVVDDTMDAVMGDRPYMIFIGDEFPDGFMSWGAYTNAVDNAAVIQNLRQIADTLEKTL